MTVSISNKIRQRIIKAGASFKSNDNISKFIEPGDMDALLNEVTDKFYDMLQSLVIDVENDHNTKETARRVAKMYTMEIFAGRYEQPPRITLFPNSSSYDNLYTSGPIAVKSTCAHHFQNITGKCWVGVFPETKVIGLSKFNRIVQHIVSRPQIQEEMTVQIADALVEYTESKHVAVIVKAEHHCMSMRGVKEHESDMTTAIMRGSFRDSPSLKNEFYQLFSSMKGHSNN